MKEGPLNAEHEAAGAKFTEFAGWRMPLSFQGILSECRAVRTAAGLFDLCHMGRFFVRGSRAGEILNRLTTNDASRLPDGKGQYTMMLNEKGGIRDDMTIFRISQEEWFMVVNASNTRKIYDVLVAEGAQVEDATDSWGLLALQGPRAPEILRRFFPQADRLPPFGILSVDSLMNRSLVSRTGYTGEDGFEIALPLEQAASLWRALREAGAAACGLGCRDTLRLECGFVLYGHEISEEITPVEADLMRWVKMEKTDFVGRRSLEERLSESERAGRRLIGFRMEGRAVPRQGCALFSEKGDRLGETTSGTFSPTLEAGIGLGYGRAAQEGARIQVEIRRQRHWGRIVPRPFYRRPRPIAAAPPARPEQN